MNEFPKHIRVDITICRKTGEWRHDLCAILLIGIWMLCASFPVRADYPIDVQRAAAEGDYFAAMLAYERMPKRLATTPAVIAAAQSAWALSLPLMATQNYEKALRDQSLSDVEKSRLELARGIIELQEGNPRVGILFAERAISKLKEISPLRSKVWLLWAESLMRVGSTGAAEEKYQSALAEAAAEEKTEINFLLAQCQLTLGHYSDAIQNFAKVPLNHARTPEAIRALAHLSLSTGDDTQAYFWLETGRNKFPDQFLDSWVDYALVTIAARGEDMNKVEELRSAARAKYPPSDPWLELLEAKVEGIHWNTRHSREVRDVGR